MIPVNEPLLNGNEKKYLNECIDTGWISSEGPFIKKLEEQFSAKNKSPFPREGRFAGPVWMALVHSYRHRRGLRNGARTRT